MAYYNNDRPDRGPRDDRRSFDRPSHDRGGRGDDRRSFDKPQMHPATCSKCGKSCMVPFIATGNRPIFCTDCFRTEGGRDDRRSDDRRGGGMDRDRRMFDAICDKCGNRCQVPFQPREGKEILCSHCFEQKGKEERGNFEARPRNNEELSAVNAKLDKILKLLESMEIVAVENAVEPHVAEVVTEEESAPKEAVKAVKAPAKKKPATKKKAASKE